jgi:release factor glutamine methyltransferase
VIVATLLDDAEAAIRDSPWTDLWRDWVARTDAEELLGLVLERPVRRSDLRYELTPTQRRRFGRLIARRTAGEPMALIRGRVDFRGMELHVRKGTFAPRPSTEFLAAHAIRRLRKRRAPLAIDVATGVGAVALAVAREVPASTVFGLDIATVPLSAARANARRLGLANVRFRRSDGLSALNGRQAGAVDVITLHPPYVARSEVRHLPREIGGYEPKVSLTDGSSDGLGLVRRVSDAATEWLRPGGWLLIEVATDRSRPTATILRRTGFVDIRSFLEPRLPVTRVVAGRWVA